MYVRRIRCLGGEPSLDEVLEDPVIQAMMARDGIAREEIVDLAVMVQGRDETDPCACG